ncbi:rod shape-determining protein [Nitrolancea hollandica]|uniref:Cell shape-determining protein MreB n=1 Tax=Nitrolancea hollandica Lb TaxID=1129897 RepID=I4EMV6_9BACT|nr:rod shape-determining protein [Nitrolancea hollandica]CCF86019.1 cell-shape determining protein [Nitrolancea hollandica Lb]
MPKQLGIDLGTANVLVFLRGRGIVINEPSVVAISARDGKVKAVGIEARNMLGREPRETIEVVRPMKNGVIADYIITQEMLRYFINKAVGRYSLIRPEVMICVPAGVTGVERRAVRDAALHAGARRAYLISEPLAAAIGAKVPVADPSGNMIIDIGGGTTEVAVISLNGIVVARSIRMGGNRFDDAISNFIKRKYNLRIGDRTAEELKIGIGTALPVEEDLTMEVRGRDEVAGLPRTIQIHANEMVEAISEPLEAIIGAVRAVLEETPPELSSDIIDKGMILTGGGALLRNLSELLSEVTGVPCYVADDPLTCVAIGTGLAIEYFDVIRDSLEEL